MSYNGTEGPIRPGTDQNCHTKMWKINTKRPQNLPNGNKKHPMTLQTRNGHKIYQNFPFQGSQKMGFFCIQINHLATLIKPAGQDRLCVFQIWAPVA
jgi:hypothetical protein